MCEAVTLIKSAFMMQSWWRMIHHQATTTNSSGFDDHHLMMMTAATAFPNESARPTRSFLFVVIVALLRTAD